MAKPLRKRIKNNFIYVFVFYLILFVRLIPRRRAFQVFEKLGAFAFWVAADVREKMIRHLTFAFGREKTDGEIRILARQSLIDLARNAVDAVRLPVYTLRDLEKFVSAEGLENLEKALARKKGAILVTGHIGSWEVLAAFVAMRGFPLYVVGARLYDPRLDRLLLKMRASGRYRNIPRGGSTQKLLKILRRGNVLGILIDQDTRVAGAFVPFFGKLAYTPVGAAILSIKTGAALVPVYIHLDEKYRHTIHILPEFECELTGDTRADATRMTAELTQILESFIRQHPTQWVWMHERWKTRPEEVNF